MVKNTQICYRCGATATSYEHVPPKGLFPEAKDLKIDLRRNLITVPSCILHNSKKSDDDEFLLICLAGCVRGNRIGHFHFLTKGLRAISRKNKDFFNQIIADAKSTTFVDKNGNILKALTGRINTKRLSTCLENIVYGLFFLEYSQVFKGTIQIINAFTESESKNHKSLIELLNYAFEADESKKGEKGENRDVFYYEFTEADKSGLISLRLCFYGALYVYVALIPNGCQEPFHLGMELVKGGVKSIFQLGDKTVEFN